MYILEGNWETQLVAQKLASTFENFGRVHTKHIPITQMGNENYWNGLFVETITNPNIYASIDKLVWNLSDEDFESYFLKLGNCKFNSVFFPFTSRF